jgi:TonB family protein
MKILLVFAFLLVVLHLTAQNPFYGSIEYTVTTTEKNDFVPSKITVHYGIGKYKAVMLMDNKLINEKMDFTLLYDMQQNKAYTVADETKKYAIKKIEPDKLWLIKKIGTKKYLNKDLIGWLVKADNSRKMTIWVSKDYTFDNQKKTFKNTDAPMVVDGFIPLIIESTKNGKKEMTITATKISKTTKVDTSIFSVKNYKLVTSMELLADGRKRENEKVDMVPDIKDDRVMVQPMDAPPAEMPIPKEEASDKVYSKVEIDPSFKGDFTTYLRKELMYPAQAKEKKIEGTIWINFIVNKDGTIYDIKLAPESPSKNELLVMEAIRVIMKSTGQWQAAQQNGHIVKAYHQQAIKFSLN